MNNIIKNTDKIRKINHNCNYMDIMKDLENNKITQDLKIGELIQAELKKIKSLSKLEILYTIMSFKNDLSKKGI